MTEAEQTVKRQLEVNPDLYSWEFQDFRKPEVIGYFTLNSGHQISWDLSGLRYICTPRDLDKVEFDLNQGLENVIRKSDDDYNNKFLYLPKWMEEEQRKGQIWREEFVTNRGLLTTLMCTPYEKKEGWIICAMQVKGVIFLYPKETEQHMKNRTHETDEQKKIFSFGYKFEQYMTSDKPNGSPNTNVPVNEGASFMGVYKLKLNNHTIIFQAEIDGIESEKEVTSLKGVNIVELKSSFSKSLNNSLKRHKSLKWWAQSHLVGVSKILCGLRDDGGKVSRIRRFNVETLPQCGKRFWNPNVCQNFCDSFLSFVKDLVQKEDSPLVVWKFEWKPGKNVTSARFEDSSDLRFLPEWFLSHNSGSETEDYGPPVEKKSKTE